VAGRGGFEAATAGDVGDIVGEVGLDLAPKIGEKWGIWWRRWRGTDFMRFGREGASGRSRNRRRRGVVGPTCRGGREGGELGGYLDFARGEIDRAEKGGVGPRGRRKGERGERAKEGEKILGRKWPKDKEGKFYLFSFYFN
jgi:hypothetical protein